MPKTCIYLSEYFYLLLLSCQILVHVDAGQLFIHSFKFFIQVPVVPLQRPDEMLIPSHSRMQTTSGYEDACDEQGIPTMFTWSYGGNEVAVEGSWDDWKTRFLRIIVCLFVFVLFLIHSIQFAFYKQPSNMNTLYRCDQEAFAAIRERLHYYESASIRSLPVQVYC